MDLDAVTVTDLTVDPHPVLAALRRHGPVARLEALDAWVVTGRSVAIEVMRDADRFTVDDPRFTTARVIGPSMLSTDGPQHTRHRDPFVGPFSDRAHLRAFERWLTDAAVHLVADVGPRGRADLRETLAAPLATKAVVRLLGLEPVGSTRVLSWYRRIVAAVEALTAAGPDADQALADDGRDAFAAFASAIRDARAHGRGTVLPPAEILDDTDLCANAAVIAFGGIETSEGATANTLWYLLTNPDQLAAVLTDRALVAAAVEESLRLEPPAATVDRYATTDMDFHGASIRVGDPVIVSLAGANRDPADYPDPDTFRLDRPNRPHTSFAFGPHACLGIHLARAQSVAAVAATLDGLSGLRLAAGALGPRGLVFRKTRRLLADWDPAP